MPLTSSAEPAIVDAFGVRFTMEDRGQPVRCHVSRRVVSTVAGQLARTNADLMTQFEAASELFEHIAGVLYDAGYQTPWIGVFGRSR